MKIKEIDRTATISWSPAESEGILLAAGTAAQQLDASFSSNSVLELYQFDINEPGLDIPVKASVQCDNRFHKLAWGSYGINEGGSHANGIIVGGCDNGVMQVYDAAKILAGKPDALVLTKNKHTGPVKAIDFNSLRSNIVASGASESEILIWDLTNPEKAMTPGSRSQPGDEVTSLAWNKQVEHILASSFSNRCVMWDLRKNEPIIKVADSTSRVKYAAVEWHPAVATQLCLASDDEVNPVIQLWDLRYATAPIRVMMAHQRGAVGLSWCKHDPDVLVSCGKDSLLKCWNPNYPHQGYELVAEIPTTSQWSFDVAFCPKNPLLIASSSFDGRVGVFGLAGGVQQPVTSSKLADSFPGMDMTLEHTPVPAQKPVAVQLREAPKWLKRPCGASFAFGGKLVKFENVKSELQPGQQHPDPEKRIVTISQVITLPEFLERSRYLDSAISSGNLGDFCEQKASTAENSNDVNIWRYLKANFSYDPSLEYLTLLGYSPDIVAQTLQGAVQGSELNDAVEALADGMGDLMQGDEFTRIDSDSDAQDSPVRRVSKPFSISTSEDFAGLLNKALLTGNVETAVKVCIENSSWSEALILASVGPADLLRRVQQLYFKKNTVTTEMIRLVIDQDWAHLVQNCELRNWQEVLVTILTYVRTEEFAHLAGLLGERLQLSSDENLSKNAMICFICSGDMERLAQGWTVSDSTADAPNSLQNLVEHVTILRKAAEARGKREAVGTGQLASKLVEYAELLASQGALELALKYLQDSNDQAIVSLRERIQYALGHQYQRPRGFQPRSRQTSESSVSSYRGGMKRPSYSAAAGPSYGSPPSTMLNGYGQPVVTQQIPAPPQPIPAQPFTPAAPKVQTILQPSKPSQPSPPVGSLPLPPMSNIAHGWNDPPTLTTYSKPKQATKTVDKVEPITHPLFGSAPSQPSVSSSPFVPGPPPPTMGGPGSGRPQQPPSVPMFSPTGAPHAPPPSVGITTPHGHTMSSGSAGSQQFAPPPSTYTPSAAPPQASPMPPPPSVGFQHSSVNTLSTKRATLPNNPTPGGNSYGGGGYGSSFPTSSPAGGYSGEVNAYTPGAPMGSGSAMSPMGPSYGDSTSFGYSPAPPASMVYSPGPPPPTSSMQPSSGMPPMSSSGFSSGLPPSSAPPQFGQSNLGGQPTVGPPPSSGFPPGPPQSSFPPSAMTPVAPPPSAMHPAGPPPVGPPPSSGYAAKPQASLNSASMGVSLPSSGNSTVPPAMFSPGPPQSSSGFLSGPPPPGTGFPPAAQGSPLPPPPSSFPTQGVSPAQASVADPFSAGPPPTSPYTPAGLSATGPPQVSTFPGSPASDFPPPANVSQMASLGGPPLGGSAGLPSSPFPPALPVNLVEPTPPRPTAADDFLSSFTSTGAAPPMFSPGPGVEKAIDALTSSPFQTYGSGELHNSPFNNQNSPVAPPPSVSPQVLPPPPLNTSTGLSPARTPTHPSPAPSPGQPYEPVAPGGVIPAEHQDLVDILEKLRQECLKVAGLPQIKRKLEDVGRKLEILKDKLRSHSISAKTLQSLHELVDAMKSRDYPKALNLHTQVCSTGNLQEISSFFPSVKVLITSAAQLNVFL